MTRSPDHPINYLEPPLGYLLRIPCGDDAAGSPLDEPARDRAEQAAAFLRFERIGRIFAPLSSAAARDTAEIVWQSCTWDFTDYFYDGGVEEWLKFLLNPDRGLPCVLVATQREIEDALRALNAADVCEGAVSSQQSAFSQREIVAPGGIISLHAHVAQPPSAGNTGGGAGATSVIIARARHMIIDFSFTDLEKTVVFAESAECSS